MECEISHHDFMSWTSTYELCHTLTVYTLDIHFFKVSTLTVVIDPLPTIQTVTHGS